MFDWSSFGLSAAIGTVMAPVLFVATRVKLRRAEYDQESVKVFAWRVAAAFFLAPMLIDLLFQFHVFR